MKKVALYVRVSSLEQAEHGYSIDEQVVKLQKYCEVHDWSVYHVYRDGGFTGSNIERPAMSQLVQDAKNKKFDSVLVYKLDRLSRSQKDTLFLIEDVFIANGIDFFSLMENFDTSSAFGKAMIGILSVFAQLEREQIKERMQLGKLGRARSGKPMNWTSVPFGYRMVDGSLVVDEFESAIVKRIFSEYTSGMSMTKIRETLNFEGHIGKDKKWSRSVISHLLQNPTYIGKVAYKDNVFDGNHEPIILPEEFEKAREFIDKRARSVTSRPFESKYLLSGLLKCAKCGGHMSIASSTEMKLKGTERYRCENKARTRNFKQPASPYKTCKSVTLRRTEIEEKVLDEIRSLQTEKHYLPKREQVVFDEKGAMQAIKNIDTKISKLNELYLNDLLDLEALKEKTADFKNTKSALLQQIADNENAPKPFDISGLPNILTLDKAEQKNIVNALIKRIDVSDVIFKIHWAI